MLPAKKVFENFTVPANGYYDLVADSSFGGTLLLRMQNANKTTKNILYQINYNSGSYQTIVSDELNQLTAYRMTNGSTTIRVFNSVGEPLSANATLIAL